MMKACKYAILFLVGGIVYMAMEMIFRGRTHWTMALVGGICFIYCGLVNEIMNWSTPLPLQMLYCSLIITSIELVAGLILNSWLGLAIWNYDRMPLNLCGQICLPYSILWYFVSLIAIVADDYMRYWLFGEEKPHYCWR